MNKAFVSVLRSFLVPRTYTHIYRKEMSSAAPVPNAVQDVAGRMVWLDMELTGLNLQNDKIMEVAVVITESDLSIVAQNGPLIIHQPSSILCAMNEWCKVHHRNSGLTEECLNSNLCIEEADDQLYEFVKKYTPQGKCCIAGNSVFYDRYFASKYLPKFNSHLHYRIVDVSTVKELCRRWRRQEYKSVPDKAYVHRALEDIFESIEELKYYREKLFTDNDK